MQLSKHALVRCQQRNVSPALLDLLFYEHDHETPVGRGLLSFWMSQCQIKKLVRDGILKKLYAEQLKKIVLLVDPETDSIISVIKTYGQKKARHYRKARGKKWGRNHQP